MFVKERFLLDPATVEELRTLTPEFGYNGFGEFIFYRTYSRMKSNGSMEDWCDVVKRVTEGTFSIRKDHYVKNHVEWDESFWQHYAKQFAISLFHMHWLPAGRGLWGMGTDFMYRVGSMLLTNCAFIEVEDNLADAAHWIMDCLMLGVGVGAHPTEEDIHTYMPNPQTVDHTIQDSREGWCDSIKILIESYTKPYSNKVIFDYSLIRPAGELIKGFGGIASGPRPLIYLHRLISHFFKQYHYCEDDYTIVQLKSDIINAIGQCVVAGNVRRSAEILLGDINDDVFVNLKNYTRYPYRAEFGWLSNNSVVLDNSSDFEKLDIIAERIKDNGEPGIVNKRNLPYGRIGKNDNIRLDAATGFNPCGEIPLESYGVCILACTLPTRCNNHAQWLKACEYATCYTSTITLLPTHRKETNRVIARTRRIGVDIIDFSGWKYTVGMTQVVKWMRKGYEHIRKVNYWLNSEAGVPEAIRVTTIKPGGTVPKLAGKTPGVGHPTHIYTLRRVRLASNSPIVPILIDAGIPFEPDINDPENTLVFEWPIEQGPAKPATDVSLWEQAMNVVLLQREWSDNAVSNTLYFRPQWTLIKDLSTVEFIGEHDGEYEIWHTKKVVFHYPKDKYKIENNQLYRFDPRHEEDDIEAVLSAITPLIKSISLLPHTADGVYAQMPESGLSREEYECRLSKIRPIDWSILSNNIAEPDTYCTGDRCEAPAR
jgi:ribonucleoside-triphosphate reductase (thioredoxin)